jgi:hypothetical protein
MGNDVFGAAPDELFHPFFKIAPRQENAVMTSHANYADVRTKPHDFPFVPAAGVRLAQANDIVHEELQRHSGSDYNIGFKPSTPRFIVRF